jgi:hypothetical protein
VLALQLTDYQRWDVGRGFSFQEPEPLCVEYLPQQPKAWNPFSCVSVHEHAHGPATHRHA